MPDIPNNRTAANTIEEHLDDHTALADFNNLIDDAGDLIVGVGVNTAGKLPKGTGLQVLRVNAGATALEYADQEAGIAVQNDAPSSPSTNDLWVDADEAAPSGTDVWQDYVPVMTQTETVTSTVARARYTQNGKTVHVEVALTVTGSGSAGAAVLITLPVNGAGGTGLPIGVAKIYDTSANVMHRGITCFNATGSDVVRLEAAATTVSGSMGVVGFTAGLAVGDSVTFSCTYEAV